MVTTDTTSDVRFPRGDELYVGMTYENFGGIEPDLTHRHSTARVFRPEMSTLLGPPVEAMTNQGRLCLVSFKPVRQGRVYSHEQVSRGDIDDWWRGEMRKLASWGRPIIITYTPERESEDEAQRFGGGVGRENLGSIFGNAYRHLLNVWEDMGAPENIRFCDTWAGWNFGLDDDGFAWLADYHPGDDRISYVGSDPYGWCPETGWSLGTFEDKIRPALQFCREVAAPLILPEVACYRHEGRPAWIDDMSYTLERRPRIKLIEWFERTTGCNWTLRGDQDSLQAWDRLMGNARAVTI